MSNEQIPGNQDNDEPVDLSVDAEAFSAPGDGESDGVGDQNMGPFTYGTTCWGTPCPSGNTYSC